MQEGPASCGLVIGCIMCSPGCCQGRAWLPGPIPPTQPEARQLGGTGVAPAPYTEHIPGDSEGLRLGWDFGPMVGDQVQAQKRRKGLGTAPRCRGRDMVMGIDCTVTTYCKIAECIMLWNWKFLVIFIFF